MKLRRPPRAVTLATAAVACALAVGGFAVGKRVDDPPPAASVPLAPLPAAGGASAVVPLPLELPRRP